MDTAQAFLADIQKSITNADQGCQLYTSQGYECLS